MDTNIQNIKEKFILELMVFSPKYNAVLAEEIVQKLTDQEMTTLLEKLTQINTTNAEELAQLEEQNPTAYDQKMQKLEAEEDKADDEFFSAVESKMLAETDEENQKIEAIEKDMDTLELDAEREVDDEYNAAEDLLKNLFQEVGLTQPAQ